MFLGFFFWLENYKQESRNGPYVKTQIILFGVKSHLYTW